MELSIRMRDLETDGRPSGTDHSAPGVRLGHVRRSRRGRARVLNRSEVLHEVRYVLGAIAQRWQDQRDDRQAIVQVLSKSPVLNHGFEISICSGDYPHVHLSRLRRSDLLDFSVLYQLPDHRSHPQGWRSGPARNWRNTVICQTTQQRLLAESKMRVSILGFGVHGRETPNGL